MALDQIGGIVGGLIASRQRVGRMILYAVQVLDHNLVWVGVVVLGILAMLMYTAVAAIEKWLLKGVDGGAAGLRDAAKSGGGGAPAMTILDRKRVAVIIARGVLLLSACGGAGAPGQ